MTTRHAGDIAVVGLGVMGINLARNLARHGFTVIGFDLDEGKRAQFERGDGEGGRQQAAVSLRQMLDRLASPRRILLMVPAGAAVDAVIDDLRPLLAPGDVIVDGGNTRYTDTQRRMASLTGTGILYVGAGVSGGEQGALLGPSIMPGGDPQAWPVVQPVLQAIAARAPDGTPCCAWMGGGASGHFVKMVHNGIEYADMQLICEAYALMRELLGLSVPAAGEVFAEWNRGELESYLTAITADILSRVDGESGQPLVDLILDTAEQKGTGKWATQAALDLGVAAPTMGEAVFARALSAAKPLRVQAAQVLPGPQGAPAAAPQLVESLRVALLGARLCAYAQGFQLLAAADAEYQWSLPMADIASVWRAGCIIRARLLEDIRAAFAAEHVPANLLLAPALAPTVARCQQAMREVLSAAVMRGVPAPAFASALAYYDGLRSARLPANLLQAQRDYFGAHRYQRVDRPGSFHTEWTT
ncbi:NADP-dependent phosphogluconate dehydrogenase [Ramlibacter sp. USB13]|uniref:6-phosphogluconate dehydrogenase, decarboxylating n=1 Tax=Ramlibacter cellulosilyticus TaxID=2764187 RepID=A0A923SDT2_9BURK|nr:NADP-dependent phosphogluconate dehydrogenase [Ramlibacter cellulosilyticus]MBC5786355.1 NADP-dependent phosphogluconate dehydrogenase [Ramlibacter cellulosilyticus]